VKVTCSTHSLNFDLDLSIFKYFLLLFYQFFFIILIGIFLNFFHNIKGDFEGLARNFKLLASFLELSLELNEKEIVSVL